MYNPKTTRKSASWLVATASDKSGGYRTIFEHAKAMQNAGWEITLYIREGKSSESTRKLIERHFSIYFQNVVIGWNQILPCDAVFATIWYSASVVESLTFKCRKYYFIQDFEPVFLPTGSQYIAAKNSYGLSLEPITLGRNLSVLLQKQYGLKSKNIDFGADLSTYKYLNQKRELALCFTYQPKKQRRCSALGITALHILKILRPEITIYLYGSNDKSKHPFSHTNLGFLSVEDCNELYNKCILGVCLSASNPSRIPYEMLASGLPVIDLWGENTCYDYPDSSITLSKDTPLSIAMAIIDMLDDDTKRNALHKNALAFMAERDISNETASLTKLIEPNNAQNTSDNTFNKLYKKDAFECKEKQTSQIQDLITNYYLPKPSIAHKIPEALHPLCKYLKNIFHVITVNKRR